MALKLGLTNNMVYLLPVSTGLPLPCAANRQGTLYSNIVLDRYRLTLYTFWMKADAVKCKWGSSSACFSSQKCRCETTR
jgi:hypothetical protein